MAQQDVLRVMLPAAMPVQQPSLPGPSIFTEATSITVAQALQAETSPLGPAPAPVPRPAEVKTDAAYEAPIPKKRGRPPKSTKAKPKPEIQKHGIASAPTDPNRIVESLHNEPDIFKSIFALFFKYKSPFMCIAFYPQYMRFFGTSHNEQATIIVDARGADMVHYFCKMNPYQVNISSEHIKTIMSNIHTGHSQIFMTMNNPTLSDKLMVVLSYFKSARLDQLQITPIGDVKSIAGIDLLDSTYPIKFELESGEFKELLADISEISAVMTIQKAGFAPLRLYTSGADNSVERCSSFTDEKEISLVSTVQATQTFQTSISIENVKPLIASGVGEKIKVSADYERGVIFKTNAGQFCEVSVAIKTYRPEIYQN